jgi:uncharacterized cupin superfamily protein
MRTSFVVHADEIPEQDGRYPAPFDAELLTAGRDLGRAAGSQRIGCWQERLPPGRRTSRMHAHSSEEEAVYVLAGHPLLRWRGLDGELHQEQLRPGSFVSFTSGTGVAHNLENPGPDEATLLVVGERRMADRCFYPEDPDLEAWRREHRAHRTWNLQEPAEPWPLRVETERLILRPWEPEEAAAFRGLALANQPHLVPWMPWAFQIGDVNEYLQRFRRWRTDIDAKRHLFLGVFTKDGRPIGGTGMHPSVGAQAFEIGYWIDQGSVGQGLVTEWVSALVHLGLTVMGCDRLEIRCLPDNERSAGVPRRLGFHHECTQRRRIPDGRGGLADVMVWTLYRDQLASTPAAQARYTAWDALGRQLRSGVE